MSVHRSEFEHQAPNGDMEQARDATMGSDLIGSQSETCAPLEAQDGSNPRLTAPSYEESAEVRGAIVADLHPAPGETADSSPGGIRIASASLEAFDGGSEPDKLLFERSRQALRIAQAIVTTCREDAEDAAASAVAKWLKQPLAGIKNKDAYFKRIVINECNSALRSLQRAFKFARPFASLPRNLGTADDQEGAPTGVPDPAIGAEISEHRVRAELAALPLKYRVVIVSRIEGLTWTEISQAVGRRESTVMSRYDKGIELLRKALRIDGGQP